MTISDCKICENAYWQEKKRKEQEAARERRIEELTEAFVRALRRGQNDIIFTIKVALGK